MALPAQVHLYHIEVEKVLNAQELAKKGQSYLYTIILGESYIFSFQIPSDNGCIAVVEFYIKPITCNLSRHTLYTVTGCYTPSYDEIQFNQVLGTAQLVYDTYIGVCRLELNSDLYCIPPLLTKLSILIVTDLNAFRPHPLHRTVYKID